MKQTKRVFAILLAMTLCLYLAACGGQTASPVSQNEPESVAAVTESSPEEAPEPVSEEAAPDSSEPQEAPEEPTAETAAEGLAARSHVTAQMGVPTVILNNGVEMPRLGLGTQIQSLEQDASEEGRKLLGDTSHDAVVAALQAGYRHLDTAHGYYNERGVGQGILDSGVPREEIWVTSKLWPSEYGEGTTMAAIDAMLERLQLDYLDCIYLHHPAGDYVGAWKDLKKAYRQGKVRALGISNFDNWPEAFSAIVDEMEIKPQTASSTVGRSSPYSVASMRLSRYSQPPISK